MRTPSFILLASLAAHLPHEAKAHESAECVALPLMTESLTPTQCVCQGGLKAIRYQGIEPTSPYSTDFDRRRVSIVLSKDHPRVKEAAGVAGVSGEKATHLINPPAEEAVAKRSSEKTPVTYDGWSVSSERIEYGSQGGGTGFTFDCATATLSKSGRSIAVAECFPVEERARYLKLLNTIGNAPLEFGAGGGSTTSNSGLDCD
jgi:hypothetical protein